MVQHEATGFDVKTWDIRASNVIRNCVEYLFTHLCIHGLQTQRALICRIHRCARWSQDPEINNITVV